MASAFSTGSRCFFEHPEESWVVGVVRDVTTKAGAHGGPRYDCEAKRSSTQPFGGSVDRVQAVVPEEGLHVLVDDTGDVVERPASPTPSDPLSPTAEVPSEAQYDDLLDLPYLHDSTLLQQVRRRYFESVIYTRIGPIVLALNPYDYALPNYVDARMPLYMDQEDTVLTQRSQLLPHAWSVAHDSYWLMRNFGSNQSIIVSGESGAGKTETAKIVVRYLGNVSTRECAEEGRVNAGEVTRRVNMTSPILEAFGNAKTLRNDNSSRFGKFMKVQFSPDGTMIGAAVEVYLLEKSRIVTHGQGERAYHAFYQLCAGADTAARTALDLIDPEHYPSLNVGRATRIPGVDDAEDYRTVAEAMGIVGLGAEEQRGVWNTVAGVLHCLALGFDRDPDGNSSVSADGRLHLAKAATAWGVAAAALEAELTQTESTVGGDTFTRRLRPEQAVDVRDALCKALYERLFLQLVERINALIDAGDKRTAAGQPAMRSWIGLLDIFGFESFEHNSFEQLCINLANETLQSHYNDYIFTRDMEECKAEGIDTTEVVFYDNQPCLDMLALGKLSVLSLLDEESALGKGTDPAFCEKVVEHFGKHANLAVDKKRRGEVFGVLHYAGEVMYDVAGFREKNSDTLKDQLKLLLRTSENPLVAALLPEPVDRRGKAPTVGGVFKAQLKQLMETINSTHPHWIRCVKPHHAKKPRMFHGAEVMSQLRYAGVLETVRIRKMSFSMRFTFADFWRQFRNLLERRMPDGGERAAAGAVLDLVGLPAARAQVGKTKVFLKTDAYHDVAHALKACMAKHVVVLQAAARAAVSARAVHAHMLQRDLCRITAALRARASAVLVRQEELHAQERYLLEHYRGVLLMQGEEAALREALEAERVGVVEECVAQRAAEEAQLRAEWAAAMAEIHAGERADAEAAEKAARYDVFEHFVGTAGLLWAAATFEGGEEGDRAELAAEEADDFDAIAIAATVSERMAAEATDARLEREHEAAVEQLLLEEDDGRTDVSVQELTAFGFACSLVSLQRHAFLALLPALLLDEAEEHEEVAAMQRQEWDTLRDEWWAAKRAADAAALAVVEKAERRARRGQRSEEEQLLVALLLQAGRDRDEAAARETAREEEEAGRRVLEEQRRLEALRQEEEEAEAERRRRARVEWYRRRKAESAAAAEEEARVQAIYARAAHMAAPVQFFSQMRCGEAKRKGPPPAALPDGLRSPSFRAASPAMSPRSEAPLLSPRARSPSAHTPRSMPSRGAVSSAAALTRLRTLARPPPHATHPPVVARLDTQSPTRATVHSEPRLLSAGRFSHRR